MTADIFGQRLQREISAMFDRPLTGRSNVSHAMIGVCLGLTDHLGDMADHRNIDQPVGL
jgi:hypothetical protein